MNLEDWDLANISDLTPFYNRQIEPLPYCYPVSVEEFDCGGSGTIGIRTKPITWTGFTPIR